MRLYLSSFRVGDHPDRLVEMVGDNRRAAVVFNAADDYDPAERDDRLETELDALETLGLEAEELDLRDFFDAKGDPQQVADALRGFGLVWVRGGNAFVLRRAASLSGFDQAITDFLDNDALVYGGYSAGVVLLAPSLRGIDICDDADTVPDGYPPTELVWHGLGLLPFAVAPHYRSPDHPETEIIDEVVDWFIDHHVPFVALRDGEVIVVDRGSTQVLPAEG